MIANGTAQRATQAFGIALVFSAASATADLPAVKFDVPTDLMASEVVDTHLHSNYRLVEINVPVSVRITRGDVRGVEQVTIEIDGGSTGLLVHDFSPQTTLGSEHSDDIKTTTTTEKSRAFDASLGGQSPIPVGGVTAQVTPTVSASNGKRTTETSTTSRFAPKKPLVVSGTLNNGRGTFFQLRPSSQTTLEGQHSLTVVFRVPDDWTGGPLEVRCWARGERKILWFDQAQVWGHACRRVNIAMQPTLSPRQFATKHVVAKQPTTEAEGSWVPVRQASAEQEEDKSASK